MPQSASRTWWVTGSVALVGAGTIAAGPLAALPNLPAPALPAVALTSGAQPNFESWTDLFADTKANTVALFDHGSTAPLPALQQLLVNQVEHVKELFGGNPTDVFTGIEDNLKAALQAPVSVFEPAANPGGHLYPSVDTTPGIGHTHNTFLGNPSDNDFAGPSHLDLFTVLDKLAGLIHADPATGGPLPDLGKIAESLMTFTGSPLSGVAWGGLAPTLSALLQTSVDIQALGHDLQAIGTDPMQVGNDLINDPANIANAFLNGYGPVGIDVLGHQGFVDLVSAIAGQSTGTFAGDLLSLDLGASITFGGLLSPGGSLFDALGIDGGAGLNYLLGTTATSINLPGEEVGPIGSLIELGQAIATSIGWDPAVDAMPLDALGL